MFLLHHAGDEASCRDGKRVAQGEQDLAEDQEDPGGGDGDSGGANDEEEGAQLGDGLVFG